eukprot:COSAG02_NODE_66012_length_256_cov_0.993631_1_plen_34_part_10
MWLSTQSCFALECGPVAVTCAHYSTLEAIRLADG